MKIKTVFLLMFLVIPSMGCGKASKDFEMTVERVDELKGNILKGIAISGTIKSGCIANEDAYNVTRDGKKVLETTARVLDVVKKNGTAYVEGEAAVTGDNVHLYIPDASTQDVRLGDVVSSDTALCGKASAEK